MHYRIKQLLQLIDEGELKLSNQTDLILSRSIDISECKTVCLALGPRGNLTTLTAAVLFLHPECQVLNHGGRRIYGNKPVDFLSDYSDEKFKRFIQFSIRISKGFRKKVGGSIVHSHAFDSKYKTEEVYEKSGLGLVKEHIQSLFWKESHETSNVIRDRNVDLGNIFKQNEQLRFLQPIRNPMDCAISNLKNTGHMRAFGLTRDASVIDTTRAVLDEIYRLGQFNQMYPGRFFYYFEHGISRNMLIDMAKFLQLEPYETWLTDSLSIMKTKPSYEHNGDLLSFYRKYVAEKFSQYPVLSEGLLLFS